MPPGWPEPRSVLLLAGWFALRQRAPPRRRHPGPQARHPGPGVRPAWFRQPGRGPRPAHPAEARRSLGHRDRRGAAYPGHRVEHHERAGVHGGRFGSHRAGRSRAARPAGSRRTGRPDRDRGVPARPHRPRMGRGAGGRALRHPPRAHRTRPVVPRPHDSHARRAGRHRRRDSRHVRHRGSGLSELAEAHAGGRAAALATGAGGGGRHSILAAPGVARADDAPPSHGDQDEAGAVFAEDGIRPRPADRAAHRSRHCRHGARMGHELVLRHRELGGRRLELVGRGAHGYVARGDGGGPGSGGRHRPARRSP